MNVFEIFVFLPSSNFLAEDEEDTIAAQEKVEGNFDHTEELDDLAREGRFFYFYFHIHAENGKCNCSCCVAFLCGCFEGVKCYSFL